MNLLAIEGGTTTIIMTYIVPGKIRDFMLRVMVTGDNEIVFAEIEKRAYHDKTCLRL